MITLSPVTGTEIACNRLCGVKTVVRIADQSRYGIIVSSPPVTIYSTYLLCMNHRSRRGTVHLYLPISTDNVCIGHRSCHGTVHMCHGIVTRYLVCITYLVVEAGILGERSVDLILSARHVNAHHLQETKGKGEVVSPVISCAFDRPHGRREPSKSY